MTLSLKVTPDHRNKCSLDSAWLHVNVLCV